tara:strand:- start:238 stop:741 length:504 start_codon:yes stop_codon:yes gene_type:complete
MNDKEEEIKELKERLKKLEDSNSKELKEEKAQPGCLSQLLVILLIVMGLSFVLSYFSSDSTGESSSIEDISITDKSEKNEKPKVDVAKRNRDQIVSSLFDQGFKSYWGQDSSLWIENPGNSKAELERFGYGFCDATKNAGMNQSYIITFWQSLRNGPSGQIVKVKCF